MEIVQQLNNTRLEEARNGIVGLIRINPKNYADAFINDPDGGRDIYIEGVESRNSALEGDLVEVRLYDQSKWKLNHNVIATRWDDWSTHLLPIINSIELNETKVESAQKTLEENVNNQSAQSETKQADKRSKRQKRKCNDDAKSQSQLGSKDHSEAIALKLPTNLPVGISKLRIEHLINLPFFNICAQKTGYVSKLIKRNHPGIVGGFLNSYSPEQALFCPTDSRVPRVLIDIRECPLDFAASSGRYKNVIFVAQISDWNPENKFAKGNLIRIIGSNDTIQSRIETLLLENHIYDLDFAQDAYDELDYLKNLPSDWFEKNSRDRRDFTNECVITIDPKTARDLDDAVSIRLVSEGIFEVGVHIADVSYFVKELTAVDYYARLRTTSVYLVDRVIPMLPRILCEQMCSLNPGEPKLTFSVVWKMDKYGQIIDEWFGRTVIKSCAKLAYEQAQDILDKPNDLSWIREGENMPVLHGFDWKHIANSLVMLNDIASNLKAKRFENGALRIDQVKIKFELDNETGNPTGFAFEERIATNYLIEEFMLLANMRVARRIHKFSDKIAFLRRHPPSSAQLLKEVKEFCDARCIYLDVTSSGSIQKSLNAITDPMMRKVISFLLLRAMKNAEYICVGSLVEGDTNFSHFALSVPYYTHFTSPIRRYADIIVHRILSLALGYEKISNEDVDSLSKMADECNKRKLSSKTISETSQKLYFNVFVQKAGFCELLACVTKIYDLSFDVILVDYNFSGRVYLDKLKPKLESLKFESHSGLRRLVLLWKPCESSKTKPVSKKSKKKNQNTCRSTLESKKNSLQIKQVMNNRQEIEIFDIIKVIVTVDDKDIGKLKVDLKTPDEVI